MFKRIWEGVVEDIHDPLEAGRVRVRIFGLHDPDKNLIPTEDLPWSIVAQNNSASVSGIGESPTGLVQGTTVLGYFRDDEQCEQPVVIGTVPGIPQDDPDPSVGFNDPDGEYPRYTGESDVNKLARGETNGTVVPTKNSGRATGVPTATGGTWSEPSSPFAAEYPHNLVYEGPTGNILETDNTPGAERLHRYHTSGTFEEVHPDGTTVTRVVKDNYTVVLGNDYVNVEGNETVNVGSNIDVNVGGKATVNVSGDADVNVGGETYVKSGSKASIEAPEIDVGVDNPEPIILGDKFYQWLITTLKPWLENHTHYGNLGFPTSPAVLAFGPFELATANQKGLIYSKKNRTQ